MGSQHACPVENIGEKEKYDLLFNVMKDYEFRDSNLIQILHYAQSLFGFLPLDVRRFIARHMDMPLARVSGVVTFYSFFATKPKGEYTVRVCLGTACYVRGGKKIMEKLKELLGIDVGDTTPDMKFSLEVMRCIGACGLAPAVTINDEVFKQVNLNKLQKIIGTYQ